MILIVTHKEDYTVDFVIDKLNKRGIEYVRLNCEDIDTDGFEIRSQKQLNVSIRQKQNFSSVWFRRIKLPFIDERYSDAEKEFLLSEYYALVQNLMLSMEVKWLSHPLAVYAAENKILQLKHAMAIGLSVPDTLLTNNRSVLAEFYQAKGRSIIIKPLSQHRVLDNDSQRLIFTNPLTDKQIDNLNQFELTPAIYQELIEKDYELRVTVVGEAVFAAKVESQTSLETRVDWRRGHLPFVKYDLPEELQSKCLALVKELNLSFGAIDIIRSKKGEYFFLEINPNGQWVWIENETGLEISNAIIDFLS